MSKLSWIKFNVLLNTSPLIHFFKLRKSNNTDIDLPKNANIAEYLHREVRVLCFIVPMSKQALIERGDIFLKTWAKRCNKFIFFTDEAGGEE